MGHRAGHRRSGHVHAPVPRRPRGVQGGVTYREAVRQLNLVAAAQFTIQVDAETTEDDERGPGRSREITGARLSERVHLWEPAVRADPEAEMTPATITLSRQLIEMARRHSVPVPWEAWGHLMRTTRSPLALDVYVWLCARLYKVPCTTRITWEQLHAQFGSRSGLCATSSARSGRVWPPSRRSGPRSAAARAPATRSATPAACASPRGGIRRISPSTRRRCRPRRRMCASRGRRSSGRPRPGSTLRRPGTTTRSWRCRSGAGAGADALRAHGERLGRWGAACAGLHAVGGTRGCDLHDRGAAVGVAGRAWRR
ncbi:hypothetical protein FCL52_06135 [Micrococcus luteus]|nr:hypothetical protein FCL52_06135 [Micrococcus luteus]